MRVLAIGLAIAVIVFVVSAGHVLFLPLLWPDLDETTLSNRTYEEERAAIEVWALVQSRPEPTSTTSRTRRLAAPSITSRTSSSVVNASGATAAMNAGVDDVRLLDGGYDWWVRAGYPVETGPARRA